MDPNATLAIIADKIRSKQERNYACYDLQKWLANGGFDPDWAAYPEAEYYYERWKDQGRHAYKVETTAGTGRIPRPLGWRPHEQERKP